MNFANVKSLFIPEGEVKQISINGTVVWNSVKNLFDKTKLVDYGYTGNTEIIDDKECIRIYDTTNHGLNITQGFESNKQYGISFDSKYVSTHGYLRVTVHYTDGTYSNIVNKDATSSWTNNTVTTASGKTVERITFSNAGNGIGYAYYADLDSIIIEETGGESYGTD